MQHECNAYSRFPAHIVPYVTTYYGRAHIDVVINDTDTWNSNAVTVQREYGVVLERHVASLAEVMDSSDVFNSVTLPLNKSQLACFNTQPTALRVTTGSTTRRAGPVSFGVLHAAAAERLVFDLQSPRHLLFHLNHLVMCVEYIHSLGIVHCDLKPENIFVRVIAATAARVNQVVLVIGGFDRSRVFEVSGDRVNWTKSTPPHLESPCEPEMDVFSLGLVFLCLLYQQQLYPSMVGWIKRQMIKCERKGQVCSPAHALLFMSRLTKTGRPNSRFALSGPLGHFMQKAYWQNSAA
jgi:serine/threonine protein kinase